MSSITNILKEKRSLRFRCVSHLGTTTVVTLHREFHVAEKTRLGSGQFGAVFRARLTDGREVAFKSIKNADNTDGPPANIREIFEREARICCALDHVNVVKVRHE